MTVGLRIDPLTARLAGIAGQTRVDTPFAMAAQLARFGLMMLVGPALATAFSRRSRRRAHAEACENAS